MRVIIYIILVILLVVCLTVSHVTFRNAYLEKGEEILAKLLYEVWYAIFILIGGIVYLNLNQRLQIWIENSNFIGRILNIVMPLVSAILLILLMIICDRVFEKCKLLRKKCKKRLMFYRKRRIIYVTFFFIAIYCIVGIVPSLGSAKEYSYIFVMFTVLIGWGIGLEELLKENPCKTIVQKIKRFFIGEKEDVLRDFYIGVQVCSILAVTGIITKKFLYKDILIWILVIVGLLFGIVFLIRMKKKT